MKSRLLSLMLAVLFVLATATGCAGSLSRGETSRKIGIAMPNDTNAKWASDSEVMHDILTQAGYEVNIQFAGDNAASQIQQIQDMIGAGCTTIIVAAVDQTSLSGNLDLGDADHQLISGGASDDAADLQNDKDRSAQDDGVNLIAYSTFITNSSIVDYYVGFDGYEAGYLQARYIESQLSLPDTTDSHTIEFFFGDPTDPLTVFQFQGAMEVLQPYLDAGTLTVRSGQTQLEDCATDGTETTAARMEELLSSTYADGDLDAVLCATDDLALTVSNVLFSNFTGGVYPVVTGLGCEEDSVNALVSGRQSMTLLEDSTGMPQEAARVAMAMAAGESVTSEDQLDNGWIEVPASLFYPETVFKDNIQQMLVDRGYFTADDDGTFLAITNYTSGYSGLLDSVEQPADTEASGSSSDTSQT